LGPDKVIRFFSHEVTMSRPNLTAHEKHAYRQRLQQLTARLSGGVGALEAEGLTAPRDATGADAPAHEADRAVRESEEQLARALLASEGHILAEATQALARLSTGTFGACERCGCAIAKARLDAVPYARTCVRCERANESAGTN
jgi:RNA polymerase-binding transcription factor DksA